ncbi:MULTISPECIES: hypothetical protein [unclassified Pseudomonas]|uniref:hypothetical protein n=1 Tax=unclassified Pseudomonas TaxID=196821 RepID=UPI002AC94DEF|nr:MULTISPECIES: hypothetical protein [unclassified Pseudomonas]MEB0045128.1 hypothetical protein [Pseudomonas sp. Dout3]MEB0096518.1 hypothetical protein [Pseudomonas sp. DC1.2]WPX61468.1 hypothetical protein RHM68_12790 [Pseudomonas sp. DC1.2]
MSNSKRFALGMVLAVLSANAAAELPQHSILSRYGMTPDELPKPSAAALLKPIEEKSLFQLQPEQPWANIRLGDGKKPEVTGNISIDHSVQQEFERCQRLRDEMLKRGERYSVCDTGIPGMP